MAPTDVASRLAPLADRSTLRITTRGRRSGKPHTVTIWFAAEGAILYLATLSAERDWVRNVMKSPQADFDLAGLRFRGRVRPITDPALTAHVDAILARKYWMAWIGSWFGKGADRAFRVDGLEAVAA